MAVVILTRFQLYSHNVKCVNGCSVFNGLMDDLFVSEVEISTQNNGPDHYPELSFSELGFLIFQQTLNVQWIIHSERTVWFLLQYLASLVVNLRVWMFRQKAIEMEETNYSSLKKIEKIYTFLFWKTFTVRQNNAT